MMKILSLSGGLGNQLFQLAGATSVFGHTNFTVEWSLGITNLNKDGEPEVFDYQIPASILLFPAKKPTKFQRKLVHLILRRSSSPKLHPKFFIIWIVSKILKFSLIPYLRAFAEVVFPKNLGANIVPSKKSRTEYLIGFFHSNLWLNSTSNKLIIDNLEPKVIDGYVANLKKLAVREKPIVLHMRLGDYVKEEKFGILPTSYYQESLELLGDLGFKGKIWVFTNDTEKSKEIFPKNFMSRALWIPNFSESSVQVLEAMRLGSAYVIGNSTFSWWSAKLARDKSAVVVAPTPWFKCADTHPDLLPENWITINPW